MLVSFSASLDIWRKKIFRPLRCTVAAVLGQWLLDVTDYIARLTI